MCGIIDVGYINITWLCLYMGIWEESTLTEMTFITRLDGVLDLN